MEKDVIEKARTSCKNADFEPSGHFLDVRKKVELGSGAVREVDDIALFGGKSNLLR